MLREILTARTRPSDKALYNIWARKLSGGWTETTITGSLPLTFRAQKAEALTDYTVYGAVAGVGVETVNLYNWTMPLAASGKYLDVNGDRQNYSRYGITDYIPVLGSTTYTLSGITGSNPACCFYDENDEFIEGVRYNSQHSITFTTPVNAKKMRFSAIIKTEFEYYHAYTMLVPDSVAPESYIPFGYQIPLSITDGTSSENITLYIGNSQLGENEYLSFADQKIYKDVSGTLTPTDPPAAFPAITAYQGENTLSSTETLGSVSVSGKIKEVTP